MLSLCMLPGSVSCTPIIFGHWKLNLLDIGQGKAYRLAVLAVPANGTRDLCTLKKVRNLKSVPLRITQ